jgi:hypothetical protein
VFRVCGIGDWTPDLVRPCRSNEMKFIPFSLPNKLGAFFGCCRPLQLIQYLM